MTVFVNPATPYLRIALEDGTYAQFQGGKLEIDEDEYGYATVLEVATTTPSIQILVNETTCQYCGVVFKGKAAKAQLGSHKKDLHFDLWQAEKEIEHATVITREVKARAGFACDVCAPVQTFGSEADLSQHVRDLHTAPPELDEDGNEVARRNPDDDPDRRPGEVAPPAAAKRSSRSRRSS